MSSEPKIAEVVAEPAMVEVPNLRGAKITEIKPDVPDKLRREIVFTFELVSKEDDKTYAGVFRARRLGLGPYAQFRAERTRLNLGQIVDEETNTINTELAYCKYAIVEAPEWWHPEELFDFDLLHAVFGFVRHWESSFRKKSVG